MKQRKILVIACQHGNETFGLKILAHLQALNNDSTFTYIAHPEAIAKGQRQIETDLNRSFGVKDVDSVETRIAARMIQDIKRLSPSLIIDLHTSTVPIGEIAILAQKNVELIQVSKKLQIKKVAVMPSSISQSSLIGQFPDKALSLEFGKNLRSNSLAKKIAFKINSLTVSETDLDEFKTQIFTVERLITHREASGLVLNNYIFNETLNGYPFLTGEKNYKEHRGFLASLEYEE